MSPLESGPKVQIEPGVMFEVQVGTHNRAKNFTTGLVTFAPDSSLSYHTHPFTESVTLLSGSVAIEIEGRRYVLEPLDNVVIPRDVAHHHHGEHGGRHGY